MRKLLGFLVACLLFVAVSAADGVPKAAFAWIDSIKALFSVISIIVIIIGGFMLFRVSKYNKDREAAQRTVDIQKDEIEALGRRVMFKDDEVKALIEQRTILQHESIELKARTDITEVIKLQQEMMKQSREHDVAVSTILQGAMERGAAQYKEVMDTLNKTLNYLSESAREANNQARLNHELLVSATGIINRIADRVIKVDEKVDAVGEAVTGVGDKLDEPKKRR